MSLDPGDILNDRYRIGEMLGRGGFGAVYQAWDIILERPCAIKENLGTNPSVERQFQREARILARLSHPNLPDVKDFFVIPGQGQYLVMDYIEGKNLDAILVEKGGKLPEDEAIWIVEQVCQALEYLHNQNPPVIHRDIKPANIKVTPKMQVVLVDFGIAKVFDSTRRTVSGAQAATPGYAPFEQYSREPTDVRSDIYSLGATLYTLLTGQAPLESISRIQGMELASPSQLNSAITPQIEGVVDKAMQMQPEQRFQNAGELMAALRVPPVVTTIRVGSTLPQPQLFSRLAEKQWTVWLGGTVMLVVFIGIIIGLFSSINGRFVERSTTKTEYDQLQMTYIEETSALETGITKGEHPQAEISLITETAIVERTQTSLAGEAQIMQIQASQVAKLTAVSESTPKGMVLIPAGEFVMGSANDTIQSEADEKPLHTVFLDDYYIDSYEVTNALYAECVEAGACEPPSDQHYFSDQVFAQHPVVYINWFQAMKYCEWRGGSLPSEAQWEKAARGGLDQRIFPWGNAASNCAQANYWGKSGGCVGGTSPTASYLPNELGLYDAAGNVWEWIFDWYLATFYEISPHEDPRGPGVGSARVLRGGSWGNVAEDIRVANRNRYDPEKRDGNTGFRCVLTH